MKIKRSRHLFSYFVQLLLATVVGLTSMLPAYHARAQEPDPGPTSVSPELHAQVLDLRQQLNGIAPYLQPAGAEPGKVDSNLWPTVSDLYGMLTPAEFTPRSGVDFSPPPLYPAPALASVTERDLHRLGVPEGTFEPALTLADLSDPFNPINRTAPYSLIAGHTAQDLGWNLFSSGRRPQVCWDCPTAATRQSFGSSKNAGTGATILNLHNKAGAALLQLINAPNGGNGNQFTGRLSNPGGWNVNSQNPFYAGPGSRQSNSSFSLQALLGYDPQQRLAYRTLFQVMMSNLYSPWSKRSTGLRLFSLGAAPTGLGAAQAGQHLEQRYVALGEQQLVLYHQDSNLSNLRTEAHRVYLFYMFYDPYYLYLDYTIKAYLQAIYTSRPSYPALYNQAHLIRSRTSPPGDGQTLRQHYYDRLLLEYYKSLVEYETAWYLYVTPNAHATVRAYTLAMTNRLGQVWGTAQVINWFANWRSRWLNAYETSSSFNTFEQGIQKLHRDYPALAEYTRLNQEVIQLLPSFENLPAVEAVTDQLDHAMTSQNVTNKVSEHYNTYINQLDTALNRTNFTAKVEQYNQRLNGLFAGDATYQQVSQLEYDSLRLLLQFQESVYQAVLECYNLLGNSCNPSTYWKVQQIYNQQLPDGTPLATALTNVTGSFHEVYNLFWYQFYHSPAYTGLEQNTVREVTAELEPVSSQVDAAQQQFRNNFGTISEVTELQNRMGSALTVMLGQPPATGLSAAEGAALAQNSIELRQKLDRMAQLARILEGELVYLPIVVKR